MFAKWEINLGKNLGANWTSGFISHLFGDYKLLCEYQSLCSPLKIENISTLRNSFGLSLHFVYKMNTDVLGKKVKDGPGPVLSLGFFSNIPRAAAAAKWEDYEGLKFYLRTKMALMLCLKTKHMKKRANNIPNNANFRGRWPGKSDCVTLAKLYKMYFFTIASSYVTYLTPPK